MDLFFSYRGQRFVWDTEKASGNLRKHRVSFDTACQVFFDPFLILADASVPDETRDAAIGSSEEGSLYYVVHLLRERSIIRIISARPVTASERRTYESSE